MPENPPIVGTVKVRPDGSLSWDLKPLVPLPPGHYAVQVLPGPLDRDGKVNVSVTLKLTMTRREWDDFRSNFSDPMRSRAVIAQAMLAQQAEVLSAAPIPDHWDGDEATL